MFSFNKKPVTGHATFGLLYMKQSDFASAVGALRAPDLVELLRLVTGACERIAQKTRGTIIRLQGDCIIAWNEDELGAGAIDYRSAAELLLQEVRESAKRLGATSGFDLKIAIAVTRGVCIFERQGNEYTRLLGDPMNRVVRLAGSGGAGAIVVDEALLPTSE